MGTKINDRLVSPSVFVMKNIKSKAGSRRKKGKFNEDQQRITILRVEKVAKQS